jgi:hypothetical protein
MAVVVGIDEAGLGPVLGPLVHSSVVFELPPGAGEPDLWELLARSVARRPRRGVLAIADSKRLYRGGGVGRGLAAIERGVLASLAVLGERPASLEALLRLLAPATLAEAAAYPWYRDLARPLPAVCDPATIGDDAARLGAAMGACGLRLTGLRAVVLLPREFNRLLDEHANKALASFAAAGRLLVAARRDRDGRALVVHLDRQGGRRRYRELLVGLWPGASIGIDEESPTSSAYRIEDGDGRLRVVVSVGAEARELPVALASMTSKYLRELLMEPFNSFWTARLPGLAPTAGYPVDGARFWRAIEPELARLGIDPDLVHRRR